MAALGEATFAKLQGVDYPTQHLGVCKTHAQLVQSLFHGTWRAVHNTKRKLWITFHDTERAVQAAETLAQRNLAYVYGRDNSLTLNASSSRIPQALQQAGLKLILNFVTQAEESVLLDTLSANTWDCTIARRTQHFGNRFDYKTKVANGPAEPLPEWLRPLCLRLGELDIGLPWGCETDQVTVNEYVAGMGIAAHVDTHSAFWDGIVVISLGSGCVMQFSRCGTNESEASAKENVFLPSRSLLILLGESRYAWTHAIPCRKWDVVDGEWLPRSRRISITLRRILHSSDGCSCSFPRCCDSRALKLNLPERI